MNIKEKIKNPFPLNKYISLRMIGTSKYGIIINSVEELIETLKYCKENNIEISIIGEGTNITIPDNLDSLVIKIDIKDIEFDNDTVKVSSGVLWDSLVSECLDKGLYGFENLSLIPGSVGAAVIQNIGAYGVEIKDFVEEVEYLDIYSGEIKKLNNNDCQFKYRDSVFKNGDLKIILSVKFKLNKKPEVNLNYNAISHLKDNITPIELREKIIEIREDKFQKDHTAGSFFKNIIVDESKLNSLKDKYENIPFYKTDNNLYKIPSAWIFDSLCDLKGYSKNGLKLSERNPIVLITEKEVDSKSLWEFIDDICKVVKDKTGLDVETEVYELKKYLL